MSRELAQKRNVRAHLADAARQSGALLLVEAEAARSARSSSAAS